jgi:type IV secretory pathway TraG/TraD family ATPase VirD4
MQSLQDLADVPADLDKDAVRGAVMENCAIQLSYAIKDPETAEWLARSTGTIQVDDEMRTVQRNVALAETVDPERRIRQAERYFIDENMFLMLPKGCAVLSVPGELARFVFTSPVNVEKTPAAREIRPAAGQTPPLSPQQTQQQHTQQAQRPAQPEAEEDFL